MKFVRLSELVEPVQSCQPGAVFSGYFPYIDIAAIDRDTKSIINPQSLSVDDPPSRARQLVTRGDVLVSTVRPNLNAVAIVNDHAKAIASTGFTVLRPRPEDLDSSYLFRWVQTPAFIKDMVRQATGASYPAVSDVIVKSSKIPLPPLEEQKRIAAILDKADAIRRKREQSIKLTDEFLRSLFLDMFGDPVRNPNGWPVTAMREVVSVTQYGTAEKSNTDPTGIPVLRMNNITYDGRWNLKDLKYMPEADSAGLVEQGDLLFNRTNSQELVGKTAVWTNREKFAFAGYLIRVRFKPGIVSPYYASAYLNSSYGKRLLLSAAQPSINMSNISASTFCRLPIPIPPINLQIEYQQIAARTERYLDRLSTASKCDLELSLCLSQRAFSGRL